MFLFWQIPFLATWTWCLPLVACFTSVAEAQSIYTCVDEKGRTITSDRLIAECADRKQRELSSSGTVKREIGPNPTVQERVNQEKKSQLEQDFQARDLAIKRLNQALLLRYPSRLVHDQQRAAALVPVNEIITAGSVYRNIELAEQRKMIVSELERYAKDPAKTPAALKNRMAENQSNVEARARFSANQAQEKIRVDLRFDEELVRLNPLWATVIQPLSGAASTPQRSPPR